MGQLLVREIKDEIIKRLKQRAVVNGRSAEAEHRAILEQALGSPADPPWIAAKRFQEAAPRSAVDSTEIIRALREGRLRTE